MWGETGLHDTHVHLDATAYAGETTEIIARANAAGVRRLTTIGIDRLSSETALALANEYDEVTATVGFHPNAIQPWANDAVAKTDLAWLASLAGQPGVVAIGEIGLDYYWNKADPQLQQWAFREQLSLARECGLPVVIHNRDAHADVMAILAEPESAGVSGVLHCFSGDSSMAERCVELGFYVGIGGPITFRNPRHAIDVATRVPLDRIVIETDAPYLTPVPYRGKRNEPAYTTFIAEKLAQLRGLSRSELAHITTTNAARLFNLE